MLDREHKANTLGDATVEYDASTGIVESVENENVNPDLTEVCDGVQCDKLCCDVW